MKITKRIPAQNKNAGVQDQPHGTLTGGDQALIVVDSGPIVKDHTLEDGVQVNDLFD
jgi:hypothetical protein